MTALELYDRIAPYLSHHENAKSALSRNRRMLKYPGLKIGYGPTGQQISTNATCVRRPYMLSDGLVCRDTCAMRMVILAVHARAHQNSVWTDI